MEKQQTVAVVDDEPNMLDALKRMLNACGLAADVFNSAKEFLASGSAESVGCLVLDINLGGISGIELRRQLAAAGTRVPVIFMSARDGDAVRRDAMSAGCIAYLRKPFSGRDLMEAIDRALGA